MMKGLVRFAALLCLSGTMMFSHPARAEDGSPACASAPPLEFVCGPVNAEDLVAVPGRAELIVSGFAMPDMAAGKLYLIDTVTRRSTEAKLEIAARPLPEYASCPAPLRPSGFQPHGIALLPGRSNSHLLYVVNHGERESIEMFAVDGARHPSALTWVGCVVLPPGTSGNGVAPLPDGGFVATKFYDIAQGNWMMQLLSLAKTGAVYAWHPTKGFAEFADARASGDNGIEISADGKWVFVNIWPEKRVLRLSTDGSSPAVSVALDFMPDNIHRAPDGTLLVGGHIADIHTLFSSKRADFPVDWSVARLDPVTLKVEYLLWEKGTHAFQGVTGAIELDGKLWLSVFHGDRVASLDLPVPKLH